MVVKLTKEQADYLKTFGTDKSKAFYYISRWGWNYPLEDGYEKVYETTKEQPFEQFDEKEKMLDAVINGYEVIVPKFKFYNFSDSSGGTALYYAGEEELTSDEEIAKEVEEDSEEYVALKLLGFVKEEV
ncbi:hypothetical protein PhiE1127_47 [Lactococcus phage 936 group phage PhiE1127]|uniref:Uncharacterized protein n=1 Tax=Lactococcus phage 936 group phage PhiE1127 TaxID=1636576 RepID=A0A126HDE9_9CAUD|nr:hypothetical protein HYO94_gp47 [Lactococcus phage 936 group phage PhiE1127]ALM64613.1 hypothetical protein PhiE1127_47 [Lactococcus phage 936 group phage PhiE1127]